MEILGREFRVVDKGLDPEEVAELMKAATGSSEDAFQRLEKFSALQAATSAMDESIAQAKELAISAKQRADAEAQREKQRIIEEAKRQASEIIEQAKAGSTDLIDSMRDVLMDAIDQAIKEAKETTSTSLSELSLGIQNELESQHVQFGPVQEWVNVSQEESPAVPESTVSEEEAVVELPEDSGADLIGLQKSLTNLEASLTSLYGGKNKVKQASEFQDTDPGTENANDEDEDASVVEVADEPASPDGADDSGYQYSGEVIVNIPAGADESWMRQLRRRMNDLPGVHIRAESGLDEKTTTVSLSIKEPVALRPLLQVMPGVDRIIEEQGNAESSSKGGLKLLSKASKKSKQPTITVEFGDDSSDVTMQS